MKQAGYDLSTQTFEGDTQGYSALQIKLHRCSSLKMDQYHAVFWPVASIRVLGREAWWHRLLLVIHGP